MPFRPLFFFIPSKVNQCSSCVYCVILLFIWLCCVTLYLYHFYFYTLLCISGDAAQDCYVYHTTLYFSLIFSLSLLRTRDVLPFSVYTFHIVYSIADCCEKLSLAIMLNKTKIVKYTCNKFSVESKLVCSLLEVVVCTIHATDTHIHQARTQNMYKQRHRHRHRDFYRMMNKLFHYCSFGSVKQTRL